MEARRRRINGRALSRLVARIPSLQEDDPAVAPLLLKGDDLQDRDVVELFRRLLLQPALTIPVAGCFRHLLTEAVSSVVESLMEGGLSLSVCGVGKQFLPLDGEKLAVNEYAAIALSRILQLCPQLRSIVFHYFSFSPPPFERLLREGKYPQADKQGFPHLLDIIQCSYRLLLLEPCTFRDIWDWSPFWDLLQWFNDPPLQASQSELTYDVRWCSVQILSIVMRLSEETARLLRSKIAGITEETSFLCMIRWQDLCQEIAVEKAVWYIEPVSFQREHVSSPSIEPSVLNVEQQYADKFQSTLQWKNWKSNNFAYVEICGIELPVRKDLFLGGRDLPSLSKSLVLTPTVRKNLEAVVMALDERQPILLEGPSGSGKTSLIREIAHITGNSDAIFIHLDDQIDSKTLLGSYVCTEVPGEFRWQPGALSQAVMKGLWIVFEDIDHAPSEILSVLSPLLESRKLYISRNTEMISAAENFQIIATTNNNKFGKLGDSSGKKFFNNMWRKVVINAPDKPEVATILKASFPSLAPIVSKLLGTLDEANGIALKSTHMEKRMHFIGHQFTMRDMIKWSKRLIASGLRFLDSSTLSSSALNIIFVEAAECFSGFISDIEYRHLMMGGIAEYWGISKEQVEYNNKLHIPSIQISSSAIQIGRALLPIQFHKKTKARSHLFVRNGHFLRILERIAVCVQEEEPVLLIGETGTGKTALVQHLANQISAQLIVLNLSQQSDSADLIGGFQPVEANKLCLCLLECFLELFHITFSSQKNTEFLMKLRQFAERGKWDQLLEAFHKAVDMVKKHAGPHTCFVQTETKTSMIVDRMTGDNLGGEQCAKRNRPLSRQLVEKWNLFSLDLDKCERQVEAAKNAFAFSFVEGALVRAFRNGYWILLDEINLAPLEILERISGIVEGSLCLTEHGDVEKIPRHSNFRLFACMNPATDVGKHDLPSSLKNRFTELYIDELTSEEDLHFFVCQHLQSVMVNPPVDSIVHFYLEARKEAETRLMDSGSQRPHYSLRSLSRVLEYTLAAMPVYGFERALYDGACMIFLTHLDKESAKIMESLIVSSLFKQYKSFSDFSKLILKVPSQPSPKHIFFEQFWLEKGDLEPTDFSSDFCKRYILTNTIKMHLKNIARAIFVPKYPVLLQGPTSSGKTSLIEYLSIVTGHKFIRINNHEHTDLQEYLGSYVTNKSGKLVFQEGALVKAVRNGHWIVLDELNLAPSDVLEALNRLLDDNRELYIPELQTMVKPHSHFMLFATQNPHGIYGGRKVLSRAFRNRFLELHVDDIPEEEICTIIEKRCDIPKSYAMRMVAVMRDLQRHRMNSKVFAGKHGFITPRDLFRWAERHRKLGVTYEDLAKSGYMLFAERLRDENEKGLVHQVLENNVRVKIDIEKLYEEISGSLEMIDFKNFLQSASVESAFGKIIWTKSMRRLFTLVEQCYMHNEPILLVGETGSGKTTVCQLLSMFHGQELHILNCHQHTEASDFLGGYRPVREREKIAEKYTDYVNKMNSSGLFREIENYNFAINIREAKVTLSRLKEITDGELTNLQRTVLADFERELTELYVKWESLFVWQDGPLLQALRRGDLFLVDEISLADDSVLERLNSILEPRRSLVLAERGGTDVEEITAHPKFLLLATMNPGGDFGKRELSPALRNRFTEIWVPPINDLEDLRSIIIERFSRPELICLVLPLLNFWKWFQLQGSRRLLTVRDLLSWITFINTMETKIGMYAALIHGVSLVLLDGLSLGSELSQAVADAFKKACFNFLLQQLPDDERPRWSHYLDVCPVQENVFTYSERMVGIDPFLIAKGKNLLERTNFELQAPTTSANVFRILRAMQLKKPVLLEGSPGVGKTSLVAALANAAGHSLVRINLSEQTDIMDLIGSDLPSEGETGPEFRWSDGIFLQALKAGHWILMDELNLASQSVLEGLNACLDHRGEVFVPELGSSFKCPETLRIFGCQNPSQQGGGRKGLPKSFLNRFTKVHVQTLAENDFFFISSSLHPNIPKPLLLKLIRFNNKLYEDTMLKHDYGHSGAPWEFNLRDILRSCTLIEGLNTNHDFKGIDCFLEFVYLQRMRNAEDRQHVLKLYHEVFGVRARVDAFPQIHVSPKYLSLGKACLKRKNTPWMQYPDMVDSPQLLPGQLKSLESIMVCVQYGWMCILAGLPCSGKTSLVRLLAKLTGHNIYEFALSTNTDTSELLGCFEQFDFFQSLKNVVSRTYQTMQEVCSLCLISVGQSINNDECLGLVKKMTAAWATFQKSLAVRSNETSSVSVSLEHILESISFDPMVLGLCSNVLQFVVHAANRCGTLSVDLLPDIKAVIEEVNKLKEIMTVKTNVGKFKWVDGGLVKALERGDWVLLENANLCNPTVLDRLNSLLEPNGKIILNERGLVNGMIKIVEAHPNFRIFLTVDPNRGEVSRAMRNRGLEVFLMQPHWAVTEYNVLSPLPSLLGEMSKTELDLRSLLTSAGLPGSVFVEAICRTHMDILKLCKKSHIGYDVTIRQLSQWIRSFQHLINRGSGIYWSLYSSWEQIYVRCLDSAEDREDCMHVFELHLANLFSDKSAEWWKSTLQVPGGWPDPLSLVQFSRMSIETSIFQDCTYFKYLLAEFIASQMLLQVGEKWMQTDNIHSWLKANEKDAKLFPVIFLRFLLYPVADVRGNMELSVLSVPIDSKFEPMLEYAFLWMMEQGSSMEKKLKLMLIQNIVVNMGKSGQILDRFIVAIEKELCHPVTLELNSLLTECNILGSSLLMLETDSYHYYDSVGSIFGSRFKQIVSLSKKQAALRRCFLQCEIEDYVMGQARSSSFRSLEPCIVKSYKLQACSPIQRSISIEFDPAVIFLYPLLMSIRTLEVKVVTVDSLSFCDAKIVRLYSQLQEWHKSMWKVVHHSELEVISLLLCWKKIKNILKLLAQMLCYPDSGFSKAMEDLWEIGLRMDMVIFETRNFSEPLLWKYGGHPKLPHSKEVFEKLTLVYEFCYAFWPRFTQGTGNLSKIIMDSTFRRLVMEGLGMMLLIVNGSLKNKPSDLVYKETLRTGHEFEDISEILLQRFMTEKMHNTSNSSQKYPAFSYLSADLCHSNGCKGADLGHKLVSERSCQAEGKLAALSIVPWLDCLGLLWDAELLTKATPLAAECGLKFSTNQSIIEKLQGMRIVISDVTEFSVKFTSRSPLDLVPHQQLLWIIDTLAGSLEKQESLKQTIQSGIHQMWFNWHAACWKDYSKISVVTRLEPVLLFQASQSSIFTNWLLQSVPVSDYSLRITQLHVISELLWNLVKTGYPDAVSSGFERASGVLQQIILAHEKSFTRENMEGIKILITLLHTRFVQRDFTWDIQTGIKQIEILLKTSSHPAFAALVDPFILPCLKLLYIDSASNTTRDLMLAHGEVWFILGNIRLRLVVPSKDIDPVAKYSFESIFLSEQLESLNLELKIRQQSDIVARCRLNTLENKEYLSRISEVKQSLDVASSKIVFRPIPSQISSLCKEVNTFRKSLTSLESITSCIGCLSGSMGKKNVEQTIQEATVWQENSTSFIHRLSNEYKAYQDISQPIQLAVFEMKFGLSLMLNAWRQKEFWLKRSYFLADQTIELLIALVGYPRRSNICKQFLKTGTCRNSKERYIKGMLKLMEDALRNNTHTMMNGDNVEMMIVEVKVLVLRTILCCIYSDVVGSRMLTSTCMELFITTLDIIKSTWLEIQQQYMTEEKAACSIKFRQKTHRMGTDIEEDEFFFRNMFPNMAWGMENSSASLLEENIADVHMTEEAVWERHLGAIECQLFFDIANVQMRVFSLFNLIDLSPNSWLISDDERHRSFHLTYNLGRFIFHGIGQELPGIMENQFVSGHLKMLSMEYEGLSFRLHRNNSALDEFNIYKDSCASEMALILRPLELLQEHIHNLLNDWPEQPILQQLVNVIQSLVTLSVDVPLIKALVGVEDLLAKAQLWEENAPRDLSFGGELNTLSRLASKWRRLELECWPRFLEGVEKQHEVNATKLWSPLYQVLYQTIGQGLNSDVKITATSLEEFLQTAPIGEFKRRLEIVKGFYGQLYMQCHFEEAGDISLKFGKLSCILYNIFNYYSQFSSLIHEKIISDKVLIEKELKDLTKLCKWDGHNYHSLAASTEKFHHKIQRLIRKYNEALMQQVSEVLCEKSNSNSNGYSGLVRHSDTMNSKQTSLVCLDEPSMDIDDAGNIRGLEKQWQLFCESKRSYLDKLASLNSDFASLYYNSLSQIMTEIGELLCNSVFSNVTCQNRQNAIEDIEKLGTIVISRATGLRENEKRRTVKKKALLDLLKALRDVGLSHHKNAIPKEEQSFEARLMQPPSEISSLLSFCQEAMQQEEYDAIRNDILVKVNDILLMWTKVNSYYYRNMTLLQQLHENSHTFHKDLNLREVKLCIQYIQYLLHLQCVQRREAHHIATRIAYIQNIIKLSGCFEKEIYRGMSSQQAMRKLMWLQKDILDTLCSIYDQISILLRVDKLPKGCYHSEAGNLKDALDVIIQPVGKCKNALDSQILPGIHLFPICDLESNWPLVITPEMEAIACNNITTLIDVKRDLDNLLHKGNILDSSPLFYSFQDTLSKGLKTLEDMKSLPEFSDASDLKLNDFYESYKKVISEVLLSIEDLKVCKSSMLKSSFAAKACSEFSGTLELSNGKLGSWFSGIEKQIGNLRLEGIFNAAQQAVSFAAEICISQPGTTNQVHTQTKMAVCCINKLLKFPCFSAIVSLFDYISMLKSVAKLCYILSSVFGTLFREGFCSFEEESVNSVVGMKNATGTGMGEGEGQKDISSQIDDEDQLLGKSQMNKEEDITSDKSLEGRDRGIEMEEDFEGDLFDMSEDELDGSGQDEADQDQQIESRIGECGEIENIVEEKLCGYDDDPSYEVKEKYETGSAVEGCGLELEFRAKEEDSPCKNCETEDENYQNKEIGVSDLSDMQCGKNEDVEDQSGEGDDLPFNKSDAYEQPSGIEPLSESQDQFEDKSVDNRAEELMPSDQQLEHMNLESLTEGMSNEDMNEALPGSKDTEEINGETSLDNAMSKDVEKQNEVLEENQGRKQSEAVTQSAIEILSVNTDLNYQLNNLNNDQSLPNSAVDSLLMTTNVLEKQSLASMQCNQYLETMAELAKSLQGQSFNSQPSFDDDEMHAIERLDANPYRSLGEAVKDWKERIKVNDRSFFAMEEANTVSTELENLDFTGDEYQFVAKDEASAAQTLGPATSDQVEHSRELCDEKSIMNYQDNNTTDDLHLGNEDANLDILSVDELSRRVVGNATETLASSKFDASIQDDMHVDQIKTDEDRPIGKELGHSFVSIEKGMLGSPVITPNEYFLSEEEMHSVRKELEMRLREADYAMEKSIDVWSKFEQLTARLSQELVEQLRLIMEPTLASRFEGDYKTGKRINMKKVIPYIASQFQKDKIWLRRTKPSKRQYQVVIAIDDSKSMSESHCGHMALEALITICRAMSVLEVGQMAVASFGERGNACLLQGFDEPFSVAAAMNMISHFSFKQDNTIADEPVADLLHYVTRMLDMAARNSVVPSGKSCLQQLVLIIADGRFHEKETLRRCIREALSRRQLLAFIVLDSVAESIMDVQSVSFSTGVPLFTKYMDTFPFPYYIVLNDIQAIPRTLADLLRQWFELMPYTSTG